MTFDLYRGSIWARGSSFNTGSTWRGVFPVHIWDLTPQVLRATINLLIHDHKYSKKS